MKKINRIRADHLLVKQKLAPTHTRAQSLIMAGLVYSGEKRIDKAGTQLKLDTILHLKGHDHPWVSRGGCKLAHALKEFQISPKNKICLDIGASTGGFTHVLVEEDAAYVFAVDVGYGQIAWSLRQNPKVNVIEKCNARYLNQKIITKPPQLIVTDASFISLRTLLPASLKLAAHKAWAVALIKPQFEITRQLLPKGGIVRDPIIHQKICNEIRDWWNSLEGWSVYDIIESPIKGAKGNIEFLIAAHYHGENTSNS